MDRIVETLLRLEGAKHKALIECDAAAYESHVHTQLHLLDSGFDLRAEARKAPGAVTALSTLLRRNTALLLNLVSTSATFALSQQTGYTSAGTRQPSLEPRIAVEA